MDKKNNIYVLPELPFGSKDLEPYISEEQLTIHYEKHHNAYVLGADSILEKLTGARSDNAELDMKSTLKSLSFNIGGHVLHSLFWENLSRSSMEGMAEDSRLTEKTIDEFGSHKRFKEEFFQTALSVEGSGWAALTICPLTQRLEIMQIEKHNANTYPNFAILLVIDMFEHAYYIDYKNDKAKYVENVWKLINWEVVNSRLEKTIK